eukprot:CAMPEP_0177755474 /NCGR_PEP_ID=MMETSP0491_2-20121128/2585_1 /TAXON_ID=63592 /ORGANISM="Tetraselmis chuii, Strain PLY429" /LENGTH=319 /DNA_ID=CAMNT_0019270973 /DNA_START=56 /DNA_END=1012 /DNA_ORIENTATION=+
MASTWRDVFLALTALGMLSFSTAETREECDYGREPGYWVNDKFTLFNPACNLQPILDKVLSLERRGSDLGDLQQAKVLTIGDSLDRKLVSSLTEELGREMDYYTPFKYKMLSSGRMKPEQTGKSARVTVGPIEFANFFIFGAGDYKEYHSLFYEAAAIPELHNTTSERICKDAPKFTKPFMPEGPDMLILASNFWDVARWWEQGNAKTGILRELADQFMKDFMASMDRAKKCFPHAQLYCVRTHPVLATDERNPQYASKRPHVVAAVNSAVREAAAEKGWCLIDLDLLTSGKTNEQQWMPDGLHPSNFVMREYGNLALN